MFLAVHTLSDAAGETIWMVKNPEGKTGALKLVCPIRSMRQQYHESNVVLVMVKRPMSVSIPAYSSSSKARGLAHTQSSCGSFLIELREEE